MLSRTQISEIMQSVDVSGLDTKDERNAARRSAVEQFLSDTVTNPRWINGLSEDDMILSDLDSYREWEK